MQEITDVKNGKQIVRTCNHIVRGCPLQEKCIKSNLVRFE